MNQFTMSQTSNQLIETHLTMMSENENEREVYAFPQAQFMNMMESNGLQNQERFEQLPPIFKKKEANHNNTHCRWCSAPDCKNSKKKRPDLSFFHFPADPECSWKWVKNIKRPDLERKPAEYLKRNNFLCSEHFEPCCFSNVATSRSRLIKGAIPTIFNLPFSSGPRHSSQSQSGSSSEQKESPMPASPALPFYLPSSLSTITELGDDASLSSGASHNSIVMQGTSHEDVYIPPSQPFTFQRHLTATASSGNENDFGYDGQKSSSWYTSHSGETSIMEEATSPLQMMDGQIKTEDGEVDDETDEGDSESEAETVVNVDNSMVLLPKGEMAIKSESENIREGHILERIEDEDGDITVVNVDNSVDVVPTDQETTDARKQKKKVAKCQKCCAMYCSNTRGNRPDLSFFNFPSDPDRSRQWVEAIKRLDLQEKSAAELYKARYAVCAEHFEDCWLQSRKRSLGMEETEGSVMVRGRLRHGAVPTLLLDVSNPPVEFELTASCSAPFQSLAPTAESMLGLKTLQEETISKRQLRPKKPKKTTPWYENLEEELFEPEPLVAPKKKSRKYCVALGCMSQAAGEVTLHLFPPESQASSRAKWIQNVGIKNFVPGPRDRLCSLHFEPRDLIGEVPGRRIRRGAYPTKFDVPPNHLLDQVDTSAPYLQRQHSIKHYKGETEDNDTASSSQPNQDCLKVFMQKDAEEQIQEIQTIFDQIKSKAMSLGQKVKFMKISVNAIRSQYMMEKEDFEKSGGNA